MNISAFVERMRGLTLNAKLVIGIVILVTAIPLQSTTAQAVLSVGVVCLTVVAWIKRCRAAAPVGIFCVTCLAVAFAGVPYSQLVLGIGLLVYAVVVWRVSWFQDNTRWIRLGSFGAEIQVLTMTSGFIAAVAVWAWYALLHPNVYDIVQNFVPAAPFGVLLVGGVLFSMVNAALEECAYRGVLLHGLDTALGRGSAALVLQALAFGALHVHGFPHGVFGVGLAMAFGLLMGIIRRRADGLLAPWLAHVFTDIVIVGIILTISRPNP